MSNKPATVAIDVPTKDSEAKPRTSRVKVPQMTFAWKERTVTVPAVKDAHGRPKKILDEAWGAVSPGTAVARFCTPS